MMNKLVGCALRFLSSAVWIACATVSIALPAGDRAPAVDMRYPENTLIQHGGPVYDVTRPPSPDLRPARGDGRTDDTEALRDAVGYLRDRHVIAHREGQAQNLRVYLPDGIYLISDTVSWRGRNTDFLYVRIVGQSRKGTILRLRDGAAGFNDPDRPKAVWQHLLPDTESGAVGGYCALRNVTIETGRDNPGAVGLLLRGVSRADLRNLRITSGDGQGSTGLLLPTPAPQGCAWDLLIEGFDYGLYLSDADPFAETHPAFAHLTLKNQRKAGLAIDQGGVELLNVLGNQGETGAAGLHLRRRGLHCVVMNSVFLAGDQVADAAIRLEEEDNQCLLARKVTTRGYARGVAQPGRDDVPGGAIKEYLNYPAARLFTDRAISLGLPIRSAPPVPTFDPGSEWADVTAYGAAGDGTTDDTEAVNAALSSGKPVVYFPSQVYRVDGTLRIPAGVQRVEFLGARLEGGRLLVAEAAAQPLLLTESGSAIRLDVEQPRPIVFRDNEGTVGNLQDQPLEVFIENSTHVGGNPNFCTKNQNVWGFGMHNEAGAGASFVCDGGALWMMNFITGRRPHPSFLVRNGGFLEALGGCAVGAGATDQTPLIVNDHSSAAVTLYTSGQSPLGTIVETQNGEMKYLYRSRHPRRFGADSNLVDSEDLVFLPLYVGDALGSPLRPNWRAEE